MKLPLVIIATLLLGARAYHLKAAHYSMASSTSRRSFIQMSQPKPPWFCKTETFKTTLSFPQIKPHLEAHKVWVAELRESGTCITSGYRVDADGKPGGGGLMLFAAQDYAAAEGLVKQDPLIANECVDWQLNQWIADVGDIALVDGGAWYAK
mmetsp:Transcript_10047/g.15903  ORF Transcript_10047/g.15903 Transcript_10047/m.15903 type:complete len:152 (+) Transcript_10047:179-634(+)